MQDGVLRLGFRHLAFPVSVDVGGCQNSFIGLADIENIEIAFRISFLSL
jgi:hypothetical protein